MRTELHYFDIFPKVVEAGKPTEITIRPMGRHVMFKGDTVVKVFPLQERIYPHDETPRQRGEYTLTPCADGCLRFTHDFRGEQEFYVVFETLYRGEMTKWRLSVYAVEGDLVGKLPLMGDLHLHTSHDGGRQDPPTVAAYLRRQGYDFIAITDHEDFTGSLECIDAYKDVPVEMNLMTGEEIHLPGCHLHCIHIGGRHSINAQVQSNLDKMKRDSAPGVMDAHPGAWSKTEGSDFPGTYSDEEFERMIHEYAETLGVPEGLPKYVYAGFKWECERIREAGGLAIFPHPYWIERGSIGYHADERLTEYMFRTKPFDAFEVLGGELYLEQNGHQAVHYYEAKARGLNIPIVGSSDSHGCVNNRSAFIAETICFAEENTPEGVMNAIRAGRSVALDTISEEFRLVGDFRLVKYACFLMNEYFPLHKDACDEQGRAMKEYYSGDREEGRAMLELTKDRIKKFWKKYFAF